MELKASVGTVVQVTLLIVAIIGFFLNQRSQNERLREQLDTISGLVDGVSTHQADIDRQLIELTVTLRATGVIER